MLGELGFYITKDNIENVIRLATSGTTGRTENLVRIRLGYIKELIAKYILLRDTLRSSAVRVQLEVVEEDRVL